MANAHEGKTFYTDLKRYPEIDADGDCGAGYALVPVLDASTEFLPFFGNNLTIYFVSIY